MNLSYLILSYLILPYLTLPYVFLCNPPLCNPPYRPNQNLITVTFLRILSYIGIEENKMTAKLTKTSLSTTNHKKYLNSTIKYWNKTRLARIKYSRF